MFDYYNYFFRQHERQFRDFERDFERDIGPRQGLGSTFRQELPMLSWFDDDFYVPSHHRRNKRTHQHSIGDSEIEKSMQELTSKFDEDYKKLRQSYH